MASLKGEFGSEAVVPVFSRSHARQGGFGILKAVFSERGRNNTALDPERSLAMHLTKSPGMTALIKKGERLRGRKFGAAIQDTFAAGREVNVARFPAWYNRLISFPNSSGIAAIRHDATSARSNAAHLSIAEDHA